MSDTMTTTLWSGWHKPPGSDWQRLTEADTEDGCWSQLFTAPRPRGGDLVVLPAGRTPWDRDRREKAHHTRR